MFAGIESGGFSALGVYNAAFAGYQLGAIDPVAGSPVITNAGLPTSTGYLFITSANLTVFTATIDDPGTPPDAPPVTAATPEPSSLLLLATGLAGAAGSLKRKLSAAK